MLDSISDPANSRYSDSPCELLISVRSLEEAKQVLQFDQQQRLASRISVSVLDIKEPNNGSLGRPLLATILEIARLLTTYPKADRPKLSVALGELFEPLVSTESVEPEWHNWFQNPSKSEQSFLEQVDYWKLGSAGAIETPDWKNRWRTAMQNLPEKKRVAVAYADDLECAAPTIESIIELAQDENCQIVLLDTFEKDLGNLFSFLDSRQLMQVACQIRERAMIFALAGSISSSNLGQALDVRPNLIGVRSAVCNVSRRNGISSQCLQEFTSEFERQHAVDRRADFFAN